MFIQTINDIKEIIDEGSLEEILNLCEEDQIEEAEKFYAENEDCEKDLHEDDKENFESFDLTTNEDIKKMFENLKEPFSLKVDERKDKK
jgi:hypothetical protein